MEQHHFIISDLHLGMGRRNDGSLDPQEDFRSEADFRKFLEHISKVRGHLVVNGDWVDFLQIEPLEFHEDHRTQDGIPLLWTAEEAIVKLNRVFDTHMEHFDALGEFLSNNDCQLTVIQGNHDPEWFFPVSEKGEAFPLQQCLRERLSDPSPEHLSFVQASLRIGSVHVEHGNQRCELVNAFQGHPEIFHHDEQGKVRVEYLWGSRLVVEFFNAIERMHPHVDNVHGMTRRVWLAIKNRWATPALGREFLLFLWNAGVPLPPASEVLGPKEPLDLLRELPDEDLRQLLVEWYEEDKEFEEEVEKAFITLGKRPVLSERTEVGLEEVVAEAESGTLLGLQPKRELREVDRLLEAEGVTAVVLGHTHEARDGGAAVSAKGYFNTGTWTPNFDVGSMKNKWRLLKGDFPEGVLDDPEAFPLHLSYVEVVDDGEVCGVALKEWPQA